MDSSLAHLVSWSESSKGNVPPPLTGPSITISPLPSPNPPTVFLFGGKLVHNRQLTDQMWSMDLNTREWTRIDAGPGPGPRYFHSMDVWEDKLVCFGGMSDTEPMSVHDDIWFFDCRTRRWLPPTQPDTPALRPSARYAHLSAVSRGKLVVSGGQHADNSWVYEINVYDLVSRRWISKTPQPEASGLHSKGAYRSVAVSSKQRVLRPRGAEVSTQSYSLDEEGEGGDIFCYSNYDFAKVRRELDVFTPAGEVSQPPLESLKQTSPPSFIIDDQSGRMRGVTQPPGLRFPTGGIVGNHFILCGLYLASSSAAFSVWSLDLTTLVWRHLEPSVLNTGSWNRAIVWPEQAKLLVFGNSEYDIASDYGRRAVNLDNIAVISLEAFGIYRPPKLQVIPKVQSNSLASIDEQLASDFEVVCEDGRRVKCSRHILTERWPWFATEQQALGDRLAGVVRDAPALDIADPLLGSFTPARLAPTHLSMPEPFPVCVALVQYFYTLSLSTALQNRAPVLSALLFISKQYKIERLGRLVVHALHERLEPSIAVGIYEIATLAGEQNLQVRALHMIHSAKGGSSSSRSHRQGPLGNHTGEDASDNSSAPPGGSQLSGSGHDADASTGGRNGGGALTSASDSFHSRAPGANVDTCRPESVTLGAEEVAEVDDLIAALSVSAHEAIILPSPVSSKCSSHAPHFPSIPRRSSSRSTPTIGSAPTSRMFRAQNTPALRTHEMPMPDLISDRESTANSEWTCPVATPVESLRESFILPLSEHRSSDSSWTMDSRSSSSSGYGLGLRSLPEDERKLNRFKSTSEASPKRPERPERKISVPEERVNMRPPPPQSLSSIQAQVITSHFANPDPFQPGTFIKNKHLSTATNSSTSSVSSRQDLRMLVPSSPVSTEYSFTLEDSPHHSPANSVSAASSALAPKHALQMDYQAGPPLPSHYHHQAGAGAPGQHPGSHYLPSNHPSSQCAPSMAAMNTDGSSIYSGTSESSSKKAAKAARAEKKAVAAAEKAQKKAEARAKFEALRSEQMLKLAVSMAEAQRKAEVAKFEPAPKPKVEPKGRLGKFGQKFTSVVLFPEGGNNSTMI